MENSERVDAIQRMQDYIEENINEPITLYELSRCAGYSPYYCTKLFKELVGKSPFDYIRSLRLTRAALKLRDEKVKVIDVALDFVFDSHEGFTRAFTKEFGISPNKYKKDVPPIYLFMPYSIHQRYLYLLKGDKKMKKKPVTNTVFVQVIERPERKLILKRAKKAEDYFSYCEEVDCEIWGLLCSIKEALYEPIGMWLPDAFRAPGTSYYAQGVEVPVDYNGKVPEGLDIITLPPCKMMVFQGQPYNDEDFEEAITQLWDVMKTYKPEIYGFEWADDDAPRFQMEPQGYRGYIEGRPVRPINK
ncbi:MAG TPA: AraC family transcriptional regulator [Clostridia bacterium]|nr:MAG: Transposon Tn10 TetD protein [Firmicutes bacterium ADurb.Bin146]HOD92255.1 AraC family transcriptional regulator [Clostridia bacterium]HQM38746.1 AraC family transcriptional regulator [Clostridia bacterium]